MRFVSYTAILALAGCAARPATTPPLEMRSAELARVQCLLVLPLENASDVPLGADAATRALVSGVDSQRTVVFPIRDLNALFLDTPFELPPGIPPSLAMELTELLQADAALYGTVEGRSRDGSPSLAVTLRLALAGSRDLLFSVTIPVVVAPGQDPDAAIAGTVKSAVAPLFQDLGGAIKPSDCFDPSRTTKLRALAVALGASPIAEVAHVPPPAKRSVKPAKSPEPLTPRQATLVKRLLSGERFTIDGILFQGRTAKLAKDAGLTELARALSEKPALKIRIEGFVDPAGGPSEDAKLSMSMAQSAGQRLIALGIAKERVSWAGRGSSRPVLPNFTLRGRAANRRIEAIGLK
jgi:outer membrane protein OmpA-like peptidoglycan-associated protein